MLLCGCTAEEAEAPGPKKDGYIARVVGDARPALRRGQAGRV